MQARQEGEPRKEQLARLEVPRASVDLMGDDLTGRQKLTVMKYLKLEDEISSLGVQRFGNNTTDNIPLKPVRDWVSEHWDKEFVLDMSKRNIPISFRASLGIALFKARITEHLSGMSDGVEIYASDGVKKVFEDNELPEPQGLTTVDYASLPPRAKADLVLPIIDNLSQAQLVAKANAIFPNGVPSLAVIMADMSLLMTLGLSGNEDKMIKFDKITNLDVQTMAADAALKNLGKIEELAALVQRHEEKEVDETIEETEKEKRPRVDFNEIDREPDLHYEEGTTFADVFPFRDGEEAQDMMRAFKRITKGKYFRGIVDEPARGEYLNIYIDEEGKLMGYYGWKEDYSIFDDEDSVSGGAEDQVKVDMLSGRIEYEFAEMNRRKNVRALAELLRDDMNANKQAVDLARSEYGQTSFSVEIGFLSALTGELKREATPEELEEDLRLNREAKQTIAQLSEDDSVENSTQLTRISDKPVDMDTVNLDYRILSSIQENYSLSRTEVSRLLFSRDSFIRRDNIGNWFDGCRSLLNRFHGVVVDTGQLFAVLGIPPTNDLSEVRSVYRRIAMNNHPDRTMGLSPEKRIEAGQRFQDAKSAYVDISSRIGKIDTNRLSPTYHLGRVSQLFQTDPAEE